MRTTNRRRASSSSAWRAGGVAWLAAACFVGGAGCVSTVGAAGDAGASPTEGLLPFEGIAVGAGRLMVVPAARLAPCGAIEEDGCGPRNGATRAVSLRYVMRARARLRVVVGTDDSPVERVVLRAPSDPAPPWRVCAGPVENDERVTWAAHPAETDEALAAGTVVRIDVLADDEDLAVAVTELVEDGVVGALCEDAPIACVRGAHCEPLPDGARCVRDGARDGRCRRGASPCDDGLTCAYPTDRGHPGTCLPRREGDGVCAEDGVCYQRCDRTGRCRERRGRDAHCDALSRPCADGLVCREGLCALELPLGAPCRNTGSAPGAEEPRCTADASCVLDGERSRCVARLAPGAPCGQPPWVGCVGSASCVDGACAALPDAPGARCDRLYGCGAGLACVGETTRTCAVRGSAGTVARARWPFCEAGLVRARTTLCVAATGATERGALGANCRSVAPRCDGDARCQYGVCVAAGREGAACEGSSCAAGLACLWSGSSSTCRRGVAPGDCAGGAACPGETRCVDGLCRAVVAEGGACEEEPGARACAAGLACSRGRCVADDAPGRACGASTPCAAGLACVGATCASATPTTGEPCDPVAAPCQGAARCVGGTCVVLAGEGEFCSAGPERNGGCELADACVGNRCVAGAVTVDATIGARFEDACAMPLDGGGERFAVRLRGEEFAWEGAGGDWTLVTSADQEVSALPQVHVAGARLELYGTLSCLRVVGEAPARRLIVHGYPPWGSALGARWQVVVQEGQPSVEVRYEGATPPPHEVALQFGSIRVLRRVELAPGAHAVRFTFPPGGS